MFDASNQNAALQPLKSIMLSQLRQAQSKLNQLPDFPLDICWEDCFYNALNALTDPLEQFVDAIEANQA